MSNLFKSNIKGAPSINVQSSKTVTAGTSQQTVAPDTGYDAMGEVVVNPTPSQSKSVTAGTTTTTVTPDSGKLLSSVSIDPTPSTPITPSSSGTQFSAGLNDMSSSGWAYDSQQSGGTIHYRSLVTLSQPQSGSFNLSDAEYNAIKSGKAIIVGGIIDASGLALQQQFQSYLHLGFGAGSLNKTIIDSTNISTYKTIHFVFSVLYASSYGGNGFIYFVYTG